MSAVSYRKARTEDVPGVMALIRAAFDGPLREHGFFETSPFASSRQPPIPNRSPWFEMGLAEDGDGFWVAESGGELAGVGLSWVRSALWYLAHLFVAPNRQGLNIGQELLNRTLQYRKEAAISNRALVTFAYNPVSISLYARYGIYPREPLYWMECPREQVNPGPVGSKVKAERVTDFEANRGKLWKIDLECIGYPRERNHRFLFSLPNVQCYLFSQGKEPQGYAYVWQNGRVGPIAAVSQKTFANIVRVSLGLAREQNAPSVGMLVTGSNEGLVGIALEQRMRILDNYLFMSSKPFPNFSNYLLYPTGAML